MPQGARFKKAALVIETAARKQVTLDVEVAREPEQHEQGLMYRRSLADGAGMLFVFERDRILSFWMKNTSIPLSIAFISADGVILETRDMEPFNLAPVQSSRSARFALEVPQSWFSRAGISAGDRILGTHDLMRN
jgi:uncharacterized membrane protein (UPF0127 family)